MAEHGSPFRPGLDDDEGLKTLLDAWRAGQADIDARLAVVYDRIQGELRSATINANTIYRLEEQVRRLEALGATAGRVAADLADDTQEYIAGGGLDSIYSAGAARHGAPFVFTAPHRAAMNVLAADTFDDVLTATKFIDADSKRFVREIGRSLSTLKLTSGTPVRTQARRLARELRPAFERRGMASVIYRDGSRHGFGEYSEMLLRTKTGMVYNMGTLNQGRVLGIEYYELLDGALCGLTSHQDSTLANGMLVDFATASAYPLAHPNCRRSVNPRPDITKDNAPDFVSVQSPAARADQAAFEASLRAQAQRRTGGREPRARRDRRPRAAPGALDAQAARVRALDERRANLVRARTLLDQQRAALLSPKPKPKVDPAILDQWGITEAQWLQARPIAKQIKADIRAISKAEANNLKEWLEDHSIHVLTRPSRLERVRDTLNSGKFRSVRRDSGYDFLETMPQKQLERTRHRMIDSDLYTPDQLVERARQLTGADFQEEEAVQWIAEQWFREDGLRSVASGRVPGYTSVEDLMPADYGLEGYRIGDLFGPDNDHAIAHVARVQADAAELYARRTLGTPKLGRAPWEMDPYEYVAELESLEEALSNSLDVVEYARDRMRELAPRDIDDGAMHPFELHDRIRTVARMAGLI